jgi:putative hydrolase
MWRIFADYHTHTVHSGGSGTVRDNAAAARKMGLEVLGIADHGPANWGHLKLTNFQVFEEMITEVKRAMEEIPGIRVLAGVEANIISFDGELDLPLEMQRSLEQVLAGFHLTVFPKTFEDGLEFLRARTLGFLSPRIQKKARNHNTKALVEAVYKNNIDIITHPGLNIDIDTAELARACAKTDTVLEINAKHGVKLIPFIQTAAREGVKFAIGSDAHSPDQIGQLEAGVRAAQEAGLRVEQIINVREE